jgi:4-diphosphocytidyl-2-C-methyl-D-erythritol kinase
MLQSLALELGADVPVCHLSRASRMRGVGSELSLIPDFAPRHAVLVNPGVMVRTADIFTALALAAGEGAFAPIPPQWTLNALRNDLTEAAIRVAPEIAAVLQELQRRPQVELARMSGSGATCFGLCASVEAAHAAAGAIAESNPAWWIRATVLQ